MNVFLSEFTGSVLVRHKSTDTEVSILRTQTLRPHEYFGIKALLFNQHQHDIVSVQALEDTHCVSFDSKSC
jgi:CRP-like cAMP-binding protein